MAWGRGKPCPYGLPIRGRGIRGRGKACPYSGHPPSENQQVVRGQDEREGIMGVEAGGGDQGVEEGRRRAGAVEEAPEKVGGGNGQKA